jgi:hypothetical protein
MEKTKMAQFHGSGKGSLIVTNQKCCKSKRFLIGSIFEFQKRPDRDSDLNKFSVKFLLEIFV